MIVIHDCRVNNRIADSERAGRDRIVVSTSRCGRDNPGSNPGHGITFFFIAFFSKIIPK